MSRIIFFLFALVIYFENHSQNSRLGTGDGLRLENLRVEYLTNPMGIDILNPRLSWVINAEGRGQLQSAYQVLVASNKELLEKNQGDLWDSDKVVSGQSNHVEYHGKVLHSNQQCFWKVRIWDKDNKPSAWSDPAIWSMGLMDPADWMDAKWITFNNPSKTHKTKENYGYLSWRADSAKSVKWIEIDFGNIYNIDSVQLWPSGGGNYQSPGFNTYGWTPKSKGFLFPVSYRLEYTKKTDFTDPKLLVDRGDTEIANPGSNPISYSFKSAKARSFRLVVTQLAKRDDWNYAFSLAEIAIFSGGQNIAIGAKVNSSDKVSVGGWSEQAVVDGIMQSQYSNLDASKKPAVMLRKDFELKKSINKASVYVTGLGLYELYINGNRIGDHLLAPEWTQYSKKIQYQTYDITPFLKQGKNTVGAQIGGGWWSGPLALERHLENAQFSLLMKMDLELDDGTKRIIKTDSSWKATIEGPILRSGIYFGEVYDATREMIGWNKPGFNDERWKSVQLLEYPEGAKNSVLVSQPNEPIKVIKEIEPINISAPSKGVYVFDMGQNMVGWCQLKLSAPKGERIVLRYAEVLKPDGNIYVDNLRGAEQINEYIWRGGIDSLEPHFTYHGFRYVEVTGYSGSPEDINLTGKVIHSAAPDAGKFKSSSKLLNQIMHNIEWVQRGNMHSVPTDCPQRTERFGWLGDMQAFTQTSIFNMDMGAFFTKWIGDIRDSQLEDGRFPNLAPHPSDFDWLRWYNAEYAPAWSDGGVIIPWLAFQNYNDTSLIQVHFDAAKRWVDFVHKNNPELIWVDRRGGDYGDWLNGAMTNLADFPREDSEIPKDLFATAFFAHSAELVSNMAKVLGRQKDASRYLDLFENIKEVFNRKFVDESGRISGETQAGYALVLNFNLVADSLRPKLATYLVESIDHYKGHLSTGIQTTHRLLLELSRNGYHKEAWRLLNLKTSPSWGHTIEEGATTIWERWDGITNDSIFQSPNMNSFNHMAFGAVGEWVWKYIVGIQLNEEYPGYKHFNIKPHLVDNLEWVNGEYESINGKIVNKWKIDNDLLTMNVIIPPNTTADVYIPIIQGASIDEGLEKIEKTDHLKFISMNEDYVIFNVAAGNYSFTSKIK